MPALVKSCHFFVQGRRACRSREIIAIASFICPSKIRLNSCYDFSLFCDLVTGFCDDRKSALSASNYQCVRQLRKMFSESLVIDHYSK